MGSLHPVNLLKKILPLNSGKLERRAVSVGDRFKRSDATFSIWVVERISNVRVSRFPLVSLSREGHPSIKKTVSLHALVEDGSFHTAI